MSAGKPIKIEVVLPLVELHRGNITRIAQALEVERESLSRKVSGSPVLRAAIEAARDRTTDLVERSFEDRAIDGDVTAQIFYLKTRAKHRGYVERQEITGAEGKEIVVTYVNRRGTPDAAPEAD